MEVKNPVNQSFGELVAIYIKCIYLSVQLDGFWQMCIPCYLPCNWDVVFPAPQILPVLLPSQPLPKMAPGNHWPIFCHCSWDFFLLRVLYKWNHFGVYSLVSGFVISSACFWGSDVLCVSIIPIYCWWCNTMDSSTLLLVDPWAIAWFLASLNKCAKSIVHRSVFSFLLVDT